VQASAYEAFFRAAWDLPWVAGAYWWKWFPNHERAGGGHDAGFPTEQTGTRGDRGVVFAYISG